MSRAVVVVVMVMVMVMVGVGTVSMMVTDQTIPVKIESPSTTMSVEHLRRILLLLFQQQQQQHHQSILYQAHVL